MSRSSACEPADRWIRPRRRSANHPETGRAQVEPLAALAAVFAVCVGLALYAGVLSSVTPEAGRDLAEPTLDRVHDRLTTGGVTVPDRLAAARAVRPEGYDVNVSLAADDRRWTAGPTPPESADDTAVRSTGVRVVPGRVDPGRLRVVVWS